MIIDTYTDALLSQLIKKRYFELGKSITQSELDALREKIRASNPGLSGSRVKFEPGAYSISSAKDIDDTIRIIEAEINALLQSGNTADKNISRTFDFVDNKLALFNHQITESLINSCALQVARKNLKPFTKVNVLTNLTGVNQNKTSAEVDIQSNSIRLPEQLGHQRISLSDLTNDDFDVFLTKGIQGNLSNAPGSEFINVVDDSDSFWLQRVASEIKEPKTMAFQVNLGQAYEISKIAMNLLGDSQEGDFLVRVLGSMDGTNWREVWPASRNTSSKFQASFLAMNFRLIRIEMTRIYPSYQIVANGQYVYEFGIDALQLWRSAYYPSAQFVSKPISFKDAFNSTRVINSISLEVFEEKPPGTEITYYLAKDVLDIDSAFQIIPGQNFKLNTSTSIDTNEQIRGRIDNNHATIDILIPDSVIPETISFFRNIYQKDVEIDGIGSGWRFENGFYHCIFELENELEINFGINFAYINGKKVNGIQLLPAGQYRFHTHKTNWAPAMTEAVDPLFPYNHKLLIEGLEDSDVYIGADFLAASKLNLVSYFDLVNNITLSQQSRFFAIYNQRPTIKIPAPPVDVTELEGWRFEKFKIRYQTPSTETPTSLVLIAKLRTNNTRYTPAIKGYSIIAGY